MKQINNIIQWLTVVLNSAFIGAMIIIAMVLVPFWQSSQPQSFLHWFTIYSGNIGNLMIPLAPGVLLLSVVVFFLNKNNRLLWGLTITFTLINILYFPIYFLPTNTSFVEQTIEISKVSNELITWSTYHWHRIYFAIAALITSILAALKSQSNSND